MGFGLFEKDSRRQCPLLWLRVVLRRHITESLSIAVRQSVIIDFVTVLRNRKLLKKVEAVTLKDLQPGKPVLGYTTQCP